MRVSAHDPVTQPDMGALLTTGEAAQILNSTRQHVVDLCKRGDLPFVTVGSHRRILRSDIEDLRARTDRLTADQRRSLWIGYAIAGKVVFDPHATLGKAKQNLAHMQGQNPRGSGKRWLEEWERLLDGSTEGVLDALTSRSPRARELRQNSPFAGVLSEAERHAVLSSIKTVQGRRRQE